MKIILNLTVLMIIVLITSACCDKTPDIVVIGNQTWTAKNLDVSTFRNGDAIPEAKTDEEWKEVGKNKQAAWCYNLNDPKNGARYGKLYNWYAVNDARGLAPAGWHVPTDEEWTVLSTFLGGEDVAGEKMKSSSGWYGYGCKMCSGGSAEFKKICSACKGTQSNSSEPFSGNGTNSSGFSGLPGGSRNSLGNFYYVRYDGNWWSASESDVSHAWFRNAWFLSSSLYRRSLPMGPPNKPFGCSVRCVKD